MEKLVPHCSLVCVFDDKRFQSVTRQRDRLLLVFKIKTGLAANHARTGSDLQSGALAGRAAKSI
jgi:hypothetical protein